MLQHTVTGIIFGLKRQVMANVAIALHKLHHSQAKDSDHGQQQFSEE